MSPAFNMTLPCNENGIILDTNVSSNVAHLLGAPVTDVFVYSHGWWNDFADAMRSYNLFSVGFEREVQGLSQSGLSLPGETFAAAIHWPSTLSETPNVIENAAEALTFYTMGKRADVVGEHGVSSLVRLLYASLRRPLRLSIIGHSFGCRVVCSALVSALAQVAQDAGGAAIDPTIRIRLALLEAAFNSDELAPGGAYAQLTAYSGVDIRLLVTTSQLDTALVKWYPIVERLANLFSGGDVQALGGAGPDAATATAWGGRGDVTVGSGFDVSQVSAHGERLVVADLTPLHKSHPAGNAGSFGGHHSDIYLPEVYRLLGGSCSALDGACHHTLPRIIIQAALLWTLMTKLNTRLRSGGESPVNSSGSTEFGRRFELADKSERWPLRWRKSAFVKPWRKRLGRASIENQRG